MFAHIHERMERVYSRVLGAPGAPGFCPPYTEPPVDVYETNDEVVVVIEVAGLKENEIELEVDGAALTFRGERAPLKGRPKRVYSQMEIGHGHFQREVALPAPVSPEGARAVYKNGILEIALPKTDPIVRRHLRLLLDR
jgi:HSP20 family protein